MSEAKLHFGGVPTAPMIKRLEAKYPEIDKMRGTILTHEELESIVGEPRDANRYRTIVSAYRKKVWREHGIMISGRGTDGAGFKILTDDEQVAFGADDRGRAKRYARRGFIAVTNVDADNLSPEKKRLRDYEIMSYGRLQAALIARKMLDDKKE